MAIDNCNRGTLAAFLSDQLEIEEKLDFLFHLDSCSKCWDAVYNRVKAEHPHFYKTSGRRVKISEKELRRIDRRQEEVVEVA